MMGAIICHHVQNCMKVDEGSILINVQVSFSLSQSVNHFFDVRVCVAFFFRLGLGLLVLPL